MVAWIYISEGHDSSAYIFTSTTNDVSLTSVRLFYYQCVSFVIVLSYGNRFLTILFYLWNSFIRKSSQKMKFYGARGEYFNISFNALSEANLLFQCLSLKYSRSILCQCDQHSRFHK